MCMLGQSDVETDNAHLTGSGTGRDEQLALSRWAIESHAPLQCEALA